MSWQCTSWALREAPAPTATARLVLIALADRCQPDGRSAWPTVDTLMAEAHTSESSVKRALKALEETGCIRRGNQKLAQWDEHGNYVPDPYRSVVWECCMNVTLEHVSEKPGRQARAERAERAERDGDGNAEQAGKADRFRGVKMTPLENGGNKPKSRGVKMTPLNPEREARGVTGDTSRGVTSDTPIVRTNTSKQISPLPPTEASPRTGESRDGKNQTAHIIEAASAPDEANRPMGEPDDERWQDAGPEPEERVPAGIRARWILDRLENRRAAMGLTPKPAGRRDTRRRHSARRTARRRRRTRHERAHGTGPRPRARQRVPGQTRRHGTPLRPPVRRTARRPDLRPANPRTPTQGACRRQPTHRKRHRGEPAGGTGILRDPGAPHARRPHRRRRRRADSHPRPRRQAAPRPRPGPRPSRTLHRARAPRRPQNPGRTSPPGEPNDRGNSTTTAPRTAAAASPATGNWSRQNDGLNQDTRTRGLVPNP